jgi:HEAT repeat protein/beta-lactamase regulating signal transducer with metallopeptidase domain
MTTMGTLTSGFVNVDAWALGPALAIIVKCTALVVLTGAATALLPRGSAALRHFLWALGIAGALALPVISTSLPWSWAVLPAFGSHSTEVASLPSAPREGRPEGVFGAAATADPASVRESMPGDRLAAERSAADHPAPAVRGQATASTGTGWPTVIGWVVVIWSVVAGLLMLRQAVGLLGLGSVTRRATPVQDPRALRALERARREVGVGRAVRVLRSARTRVPLTWGVRSPVVLLPERSREWTGERLRLVLQHELAHVRRLDALTDTFAGLACAIYWFNPLIWWAASRLRAESEHASDDLVLGSGARASAYAGHLLDIATQVGGSLAPAGALPLAQRTRFEGRLLAILDPARERSTLPRGSAWALSAVLVGSVVLLGAVSPSEPEVTLTREGVRTPVTVTDTEATDDPAAAPPAADPVEEVVSLPEPHEAYAPKAGVDTQPTSPDEEVVVDTTSVRALTRALLNDESEDVRRSAAWALGQIEDRAATEALSQAAQVDASVEVRRTSVWALGQIEDPASVPALDAALEDADAEVRATALWALGQVQSPEAVGPLLGVLRDADPDVRRTAAWALGQIESPEAVGPLVAALDDEDAQVREQVVWALGQIESDAAVDGLAATLRGDTDDDVRRQAAWALGQIESNAALPALVQALADADPSIARTAAWAIGQIEPPTAPQELMDAAQTGTGELRATALWALAQIEDPAAVSTFIAALRDGDPEIRGQALRGLAQIRDEAAIGALAELLQDPDPEVRSAAARALAGRGGGWPNPQPRPQPRPRPRPRPNGN